MKAKTVKCFELDLMEKLRDPEFASAYIMSAVVDNDLAFLPICRVLEWKFKFDRKKLMSEKFPEME